MKPAEENEVKDTTQMPQDIRDNVLMFMLEQMKEMRAEMAAMRNGSSAQTGPSKKTGKTRSPGNPQIDTRTGITYKSKASAAKAVFPEFEGRALKDGRIFKWHGWAFHDILALDPGRFMEYRGEKGHLEEDPDYILNMNTVQVEDKPVEEEPKVEIVEKVAPVEAQTKGQPKK